MTERSSRHLRRLLLRESTFFGSRSEVTTVYGQTGFRPSDVLVWVSRLTSRANSYFTGGDSSRVVEYFAPSLPYLFYIEIPLHSERLKYARTPGNVCSNLVVMDGEEGKTHGRLHRGF